MNLFYFLKLSAKAEVIFLEIIVCAEKLPMNVGWMSQFALSVQSYGGLEMFFEVLRD